MALMNNTTVLGTIMPVDTGKVFTQSNKSWGIPKDKEQKAENAVSFACYLYLEMLHADLHAPLQISHSVVQLLERYGIPGYVRANSQLFQTCTEAGTLDFAFPQPNQIAILASDPNWYNFLVAFGNWNLPIEKKALVLRFLKRFTVDDAKTLLHDCVEKFYKTNQACYYKDTVGHAVQKPVSSGSNYGRKIFDGRYESPNNYMERNIVDLASKYVKWALEGFNFGNVVMEFNNSLPTTHGTEDCCSDFRHRFLYLYFGKQILPTAEYKEGKKISYSGFPLAVEPISKDAWPFKPDFWNVEVTGVPKDTKSYRIISPINPFLLAWEKALYTEIMRCLKAKGLDKVITLEDQDVARSIVYKSSDGRMRYSTVDLSSASDTLRHSLVCSLVSGVPELRWCLENTRPKTFSIDPEVFKDTTRRKGEQEIDHERLWMFAPMGCAYTTVMQSICFWAIDSAALQIFFSITLLGGNPTHHKVFVCAGSGYGSMFHPNDNRKLLEKYLKETYQARVVSFEGERLFVNLVIVVGDDQQVPTEAAEFVLDILSHMGFLPNYDKSFYDENHLFRESCGAEAFAGLQPVDGYYFPRHALRLSAPKEIGSLHDFSIVDHSFWTGRDSSGNPYDENTLTMLIALSKMLWLRGFPNTAADMSKWIISSIKGMTSSAIGEPADDVWMDFDIVHRYARLPFAQFLDIPQESEWTPYKPYDHQKWASDWVKKADSKGAYAFRFERKLVDAKYDLGGDKVKKSYTTRGHVEIPMPDMITDDMSHKYPLHWAIVRKATSSYESLRVSSSFHDDCAICKMLEQYPYRTRGWDDIIEYEDRQLFYKDGPFYATELDALLKISTPRRHLWDEITLKYGARG